MIDDEVQNLILFHWIVVTPILRVAKGRVESICEVDMRRFMKGYKQVTVAYYSIKLVSLIFSPLERQIDRAPLFP